MKLGFIGTGALTSAIVAGLKSSENDGSSILLSPRNAETAALLAAYYPSVQVAPDNQAVLDGSNTVMLAVRPQVAHDVIQTLRFRSDHHVISLIATLSRDEVAAMVAPAQHVTKALPMPMVAYRQGATIICPPDSATSALFGKLGKVIEVDDVAEFDALSVATATFATYFKYLDTIQQWLEGQGVAPSRARDYIAALFKALASAPEASPDANFMELSEEYATRGGINEEVLRKLTEQRLFDAFSKSLDGIHRRILGA